MDALAFLPAPEVAARVRDGSSRPVRSSRPCIRRIEALDPQLGAFVELDARARARRGGRDRRGRPARVRRRADRGQGEHARGRAVHELRLALPGRAPADAQRLPRAAAARRRVRRGRHDEPAGVRDPADHRAAPHRADAQPVGHDAHARRLLRRLGGGGRRGPRPDRARQRRRRLAADPRRLLRARRPQAEPRADLARPRPRRLLPRRGRRAHAHGRRDRAAARRARPATRPATRPGRPRPAEPYTLAMRRDPGGCGSRCRSTTRSGSTSTRRSCAGCTTRPTRCAGSGHEVVEDAPGPARPGLARHLPRRVRPAGRARDRATASCSPGDRRARTRSSRCRARCSSTRATLLVDRPTSRRSRSCRRSRATRSRSSPTTTCC